MDTTLSRVYVTSAAEIRDAAAEHGLTAPEVVAILLRLRDMHPDDYRQLADEWPRATRKRAPDGKWKKVTPGA